VGSSLVAVNVNFLPRVVESSLHISLMFQKHPYTFLIKAELLALRAGTNRLAEFSLDVIAHVWCDVSVP
jgi:hypothetical protein